MQLSRKLLAVALGVVSIALLGWLCGSLTGAANQSPYVVAAVIPALLTAAGTLVWFKVPKHDNNMVFIGAITSAFVVLIFCLFFIRGISDGARGVAERTQISVAEELKILREVRRVFLEECTKIEYTIKKNRDALGLPPLSPSLSPCKLPSNLK